MQEQFPPFVEVLLWYTEEKGVQDLILAVSDPIREKGEIIHL